MSFLDLVVYLQCRADGNLGLCGWAIRKECPGDPPLPNPANINIVDSEFLENKLNLCLLHEFHHVLQSFRRETIYTDDDTTNES